ncbi:MAG: nicotinate phosphoribosyltransferase [Thermomicrobiales bacterium]|nr:nicotinate phosphoribosyltransferase [Thermomicrobiales bacterium]
MGELRKPRFYQASIDEIRAGETTDVYFVRTEQIIREAGLDRHVRAEFSIKGLPHDYPWAVFAGLEEVLALLDGLNINLRGIREGTVIRPHQPIMEIEGSYLSFARLETAILGLICEASGVATKAARIRTFARDRILASFGARRMHPAIAPVIERAAFIGGCDGVSVVKSARELGEDPTGTTPHALMLIVGDTVKAMQLFDDLVEPGAQRIALIDTFEDEKFEAIRVAEALGERLNGVRLDTPGSRRGNFAQILREVRWELDLRGFQHVRLLASGGLDEREVAALYDYVDGYGVGTSIANARTIDFGMDIVEIEGRPVSKRGKMSGGKQVWRDPATLLDVVLPLGKGPEDSSPVSMLNPIIENGTLVDPVPDPHALRQFVLDQLAVVGGEIVPKNEDD